MVTLIPFLEQNPLLSFVMISNIQVYDISTKYIIINGMVKSKV